MQRSKSVTTSSPSTHSSSSISKTPIDSPSSHSTMFSIQKPEMAHRLRILPINSCSQLTPPRKLPTAFPNSLSNSVIEKSPRVGNSPLSDNLRFV